MDKRTKGFLLLLAALFLVTTTRGWASLVLKRATFYPSSATLLWEGTVTPVRGVATLGYLPADALKDSVEVQISKPLELVELRIQEVKEDPRLARLKGEVTRLKGKLEGLRAQKAFLKGLLSPEKGEKGQVWWAKLPWRETMARVQAIASKMVSLSLEMEDLEKKLTRKERELKTWRLAHKWKVLALVQGSSPAKARMAYRVKKTYWKPLYSARLVKDRVTLQFMARVHQETGMDWPGVKVVLSTAQPRGRVAPPSPTPLYLRPIKPVRILRAMPMAAKGMNKEAAPSSREAGYTLLEGVALYTPPGTLYLASGKDSVTKIKSWNLTPKLERFCYAVADPSVYITATLDSLPQILPPGKIQLYQGSSLVGETYLTFKAPLKLSFGRDQTLKVKRVQVKRFLDKKFGGKVEITLAYETTITNLGPRAKKVKVVERIPVSQDERIQVKFKGAQPPVEPDKEKGFLKWMVTVPPQGKSRVSYTFSVKYPEKLHLNYSF